MKLSKTLLTALLMGIGLTSQAQTITTVAGSGTLGFAGDGGLATAAACRLSRPSGVAVDAAGNIYIADKSNYRIRKVDGSTGIITTIAGNGMFSDLGDGGPATDASLLEPLAVAVDAANNIYVITSVNRVRKIDGTTGIISAFAGYGSTTGLYSGDGGPATAAGLNDPQALLVDATGNVYIADHGNRVIRKVTPSGIISTVYGNHYVSSGYSGDGGPATAAGLSGPRGMCFDRLGNFYFADISAGVIRKVNTSGIISTVAGHYTAIHGGAGVGGYSDGDGGPATSTACIFKFPSDVAVDSFLNIYIADQYSSYIRKVDATTGIIDAYVGLGGASSYTGNGGPAIAATLNYPRGLTFDTEWNLFIADQNNDAIRKVSPGESIIDTGTGPVLVNPVNLSGEQDVIITPNPTKSNISISSNYIITTIEVSNILGQKLLQKNVGLHETSIDFNNLPNGVYFIKIDNKKRYKVIKE